MEDREFLIFSEPFRREVCEGIDHLILIPELKKRHYLRTGNDPRHHPGMIQIRDPESPSKRIWVYCVSSKILRDV